MEEESGDTTFNNLNCWQQFRLKLILEGIIVGALAGLLVIFYRLALQYMEQLTKKIYLIQLEKPLFIPIWFIILLIASYIVGSMMKNNPMISGGGIPQVEGIIQGRLTANWWKVIVGKFFGGVIAIGAGLSLGRASPSIQLGASVGQGVSKIFTRIKGDEKYLMTSGASAGLAATFNAPLAGVIFTLEEIHKSFSPLVLLSAISAAVTADFISKLFFGLKPLFHFKTLKVLPLKYYFYLIIFGIILGVLGAVYNYTLLKTQKLYSRFKWLPTQFKPSIAFIFAGMLGLVLPKALGGGYELVISVIGDNIAMKILIVLLLVKFIFTIISVGSGVPGGIFLPTLALGALTGAIYGKVLITAFSFNPEYMNNFIILGMAGYLAAILKTPITSCILITEMTGVFTPLLSLSIVCIIAYIIADLLKSKPVSKTILKNDSCKYEGKYNIKNII